MKDEYELLLAMCNKVSESIEDTLGDDTEVAIYIRHKETSVLSATQDTAETIHHILSNVLEGVNADPTDASFLH